MRVARSALLAASLIPFTIADVKFTSVTGGDALTVGYGPSPITVEWTESGNGPKLSELESYILDLCAGTNDNFVSTKNSRADSPEACCPPNTKFSQVSVKTITSKGVHAFGNIAKGIILPTDGGDAENA